MGLKTVFPLEFGYKFDDYISLMRSILIKSLYDSDIKSSSGYKGMQKSNHFNECWTIKFEYLKGVYGLALSDVKDGTAEFRLYYFPDEAEKLVDSSSLFESILISKEDYLKKIRNFLSFKEIYLNFEIARVYLRFSKDGISVMFKSLLRDRLYSKDGVYLNDKAIIKSGGIDKNFPSFGVSLPFINFFHIAMDKIYKTDLESARVYKKTIYPKIYDKFGNLYDKKDNKLTQICINITYGKADREFDTKNLKKIPNDSHLHKFLRNLKEKNLEFKSQNAGINFFVVTGYLGSGKTKFLQNFIEYEVGQSRFTGVIQNEIGKIGLDGDLVDASYALVEIDEGCVCCSMAGQIRSAVAMLEPKNPDTILLETTGVANPFNLLSELDEVKDVVNLCGIITLVDGLNFLDTYEKADIVLEQVKAADIILLNKIDLISDDEKEKIRQILYENNRCAEIFETMNGEINPNFLLQNKNQTSFMASLLIEGEFHTTHADDKIKSFKKDLHDEIDRDEFVKFIKELPDSFYRIKGLMSFRGDTKQYVFQYVNKKFDITLFSNEKKCANFLVFIGKNIDEGINFPFGKA
ncbi:MAG: GTP-binding protein [Campylobacteraceae bacterium]|nr:GTP-binding protein [Campylobacteraceae bacterium]